jgi:hypothetical protein
MTSNILDTPTTATSKTIGMVLLWNCNYDYESLNNDITWITIVPDTNKQFFSGKDIEKIITKLEKDNEAISCYVSRSLDKIIISKIKPFQEDANPF